MALNMQLENWMKPLFGLLQTMNSKMPFVDAHRLLYAAVLNELGPDLAQLAVEYAALHEEWRPSPAKLRQTALRLASPYPDAETVYAEIMFEAQQTGLYGRRDPLRPGCPLLGPPPMSHPLVSDVIVLVGGWEVICKAEDAFLAALPNMIRRAHDRAAANWEGAVAQELRLPPPRRSPRYFTLAPFFEAPAWFLPPVAYELRALPAGETEEPQPELSSQEVQELLERFGLDKQERIGRAMPAGLLVK